jgi:hypothetical protein
MINRKTSSRKKEIFFTLKHCSLQSLLTLRKCLHLIFSSKTRRKRRFTSLITATVLFFALCNNGCFGPRVEFNPPDPKLVGKVIHFTIPVTYLVLSDKTHAEYWGYKYVRFQGEKIVREIVSRKDMEEPYIMKGNIPTEDIKEGMAFTILGTYWIRNNPIKKAFAGESEKVILQDQNGRLSTASKVFLEIASSM